MRMTVLDKNKNKEVFVGSFDVKTKIFNKNVSPEHFMIAEKGYGIQEETIKKLETLGCELIHIITSTQTLEYPFDSIKSRVAKDYGHGAQIFLTVREAIVRKKPVQIPSWLRKG